MNYRTWEDSVPAELKGDAVWRIEAYRLALFAAELAWHDVTRLVRDRRTLSLADQLYRAAGGVSADIEEGYSRSSGRDRARFYEYGLGSAREARGWYVKGRHVLGEPVALHRVQLTTQVIRLLLTMIPNQRYPTLAEDSAPYETALPELHTHDQPLLANLIEVVPMP